MHIIERYPLCKYSVYSGDLLIAFWSFLTERGLTHNLSTCIYKILVEKHAGYFDGDGKQTKLL